MIRRPPRSTQGVSSAASDVYKRQNNTCVARRLRHMPVENDRLSTTALGALEPAARAYWLSCLIGVALPARVHERPRFGRSMSQSMRMQDKHTISRLKCAVNISLQLPYRFPWREFRLYLWRSNVETQHPLCVHFPSHTSCAVSYTHLRAHETDSYLVCRLLLEKKK